MPTTPALLTATGTIRRIGTIMLASASSKLFVPGFKVVILWSVPFKVHYLPGMTRSIGRVGLLTSFATKGKKWQIL